MNTFHEVNTYKKDCFQVFWTVDRRSVLISYDKKTIQFTRDKCFKVIRPEKDNIVDIVKIDGSRFSGKDGKPTAIFFVPWRASRKEWSTCGPLREYSIEDMFNNTIEEVEHPYINI